MTTTIRNVRVFSSAKDELLLRLQLEHTLGAAQLMPGMPPAAILCVRHMADPLPGQLTIPALRPANQWEAAMRATLARIAHHAARPALSAPPSNAPAVWFADRAELLACLASDWCTGQYAERWWWRVLLRNQRELVEPARQVPVAWRATPQAIPAALALLHNRGEGARFLALLPTTEVVALSQAVIQAFGLPAHETRHNPLATDRPQPTPAKNLPGIIFSAQQPSETHSEPAVLHLLAQASHLLDPPRHSLYALCMLLAHAPMQARAAWPTQITEWATKGRLADSPAHSTASTPPEAQKIPDQCAASAKTTEPRTIDDYSETPNAAKVQYRTNDRAMPIADFAATPTTNRPLLQNSHSWPTEGIVTQFGGVFFLINLALHLELYGDFSRPLHAGIGLSPWRLLQLLGPHLLGAHVPSDPLWELLATLADDTPDSTPLFWRMPRAWLEPFDGTLVVAYQHNWLQVLHQAGFVVSERLVPLGRHRQKPLRRTASLHAHITAHGKQRSTSHGICFAHPPNTLEGWVARLACYAQARLTLALGGSAEIKRALTLPARVFLSDTQLDVMFSLNELPITVRYAGLDRDPGWLPAAGRDIRFHFA